MGSGTAAWTQISSNGYDLEEEGGQRGFLLRTEYLAGANMTYVVCEFQYSDIVQYTEKKHPGFLEGFSEALPKQNAKHKFQRSTGEKKPSLFAEVRLSCPESPR